MGLGDEARKFAEAAEALNKKQSGAKAMNDKPNLGGAAQEFANNAAKLAEKMQPASPTLDRVPTSNEGFLGSAKDLNAKMYADTYIIPQIDKLIAGHNDGSGIPKSEIKSTFEDIMSQMVENKLMTRQEVDAYTAPSQVAAQKKTGILNVFNKTEYVDGPSQFQQDINSSMTFKDDKLESPNLKSFKDKLMNTLGNICNSLGLKDLAQSCRQSISKPNLEKTYAAEKDMSNLTSKVAKQAKQIEGKDGTPEAGRVAKRAQDILAKRQGGQDSGRGR